MSASVSLSLSGDQHDHLKGFLFPGDGKEAVALLLCGRRAGDRRERLMVREIHGIPYDQCSQRTETLATWQPDYIAPMLDRAAEEVLSVIKVHSHPTGFAAFSPTDDEGDARLLPMIRGWVEADITHGSAVMLPGGAMFGRALRSDGHLRSIESIAVVGDDLHFWYADARGPRVPSFVASHAQAFGEGTIERLQRLSVAVVGASGTGSPLIEQLVRLRNLSTTLRHFANQFSEPSFPWPSAPSPGSAPSTSLTGSARLIQTSALSSAARGGPATKRSERAA